MRWTLQALCAAAAVAACGPVDTSGTGASGPQGGGVATSGGAAAPPGTGSAPAISIVQPADGEECELDEDEQAGCAVTVSVAGAVLAAPGACGGASGSCGHIDFYIDGAACGSPNTQAWTRSFLAQPGKCHPVSGQHAFYCELRNDRGERLAASQSVMVDVKQGD